MIRRSAPALALASTLFFSSVAHARHCPNVMFVLDRSGSMSSDPNGGAQHPNKWELSRTAIIAALQKYGDKLAWGLQMFTSSGSGAACYTDTKIDVQVAHGTAAQITSVLNASNPLGGTNTGEAIKRAYTDGALHDPNRGNYIILITDGDPNCNGMEPAYTNAELANAAAQTPSIHTFVVGFDGSGGVNPKNLNDMAKLGQEPIPGCDPSKPNLPCYYSASTSQRFLDAMTQILGSLAGGSVIGGCDDSCFTDGCPSGQICGIPTGKTDSECFPDPCSNIVCDASAYCKNGKCTIPCPTCNAGEACVDGNCAADPCGGVQCPNGQACEPSTGRCIADKCVQSTLNCPLPLYCDPATGLCADDPCRLVQCPLNSTCFNGWCMTDPPPVDMAVDTTPDLSMDPNQPVPDMSVAPTEDSGTVKIAPKGCNASGRTGDASGLLFVGLCLVALAARRRRA